MTVRAALRAWRVRQPDGDYQALATDEALVRVAFPRALQLDPLNPKQSLSAAVEATYWIACIPGLLNAPMRVAKMWVPVGETRAQIDAVLHDAIDEQFIEQGRRSGYRRYPGGASLGLGADDWLKAAVKGRRATRWQTRLNLDHVAETALRGMAPTEVAARGIGASPSYAADFLLHSTAFQDDLGALYETVLPGISARFSTGELTGWAMRAAAMGFDAGARQQDISRAGALVQGEALLVWSPGRKAGDALMPRVYCNGPASHPELVRADPQLSTCLAALGISAATWRDALTRYCQRTGRPAPGNQWDDFQVPGVDGRRKPVVTADAFIKALSQMRNGASLVGVGVAQVPELLAVPPGELVRIHGVALGLYDSASNDWQPLDTTQRDLKVRHSPEEWVSHGRSGIAPPAHLLPGKIMRLHWDQAAERSRCAAAFNELLNRAESAGQVQKVGGQDTLIADLGDGQIGLPLEQVVRNALAYYERAYASNEPPFTPAP